MREVCTKNRWRWLLASYAETVRVVEIKAAHTVIACLLGKFRNSGRYTGSTHVDVVSFGGVLHHNISGIAGEEHAVVKAALNAIGVAFRVLLVATRAVICEVAAVCHAGRAVSILVVRYIKRRRH
jgi:hypothetical protein